jgi:hypothetical protein
MYEFQVLLKFTAQDFSRILARFHRIAPVGPLIIFNLELGIILNWASAHAVHSASNGIARAGPGD